MVDLGTPPAVKGLKVYFSYFSFLEPRSWLRVAALPRGSVLFSCFNNQVDRAERYSPLPNH